MQVLSSFEFEQVSGGHRDIVATLFHRKIVATSHGNLVAASAAHRDITINTVADHGN